MQYKEITEKIIGCAYIVYNKIRRLPEVHARPVKCFCTLYLTGEAQLVNYLVATGKEIRLLLNFGEQRVEVKRKVKDLNLISAE